MSVWFPSSKFSSSWGCLGLDLGILFWFSEFWSLGGLISGEDLFSFKHELGVLFIVKEIENHDAVRGGFCFLSSMSWSGGEAELGLDEIKALVREVVENEIEKHAADGLGGLILRW